VGVATGATPPRHRGPRRRAARGHEPALLRTPKGQVQEAHSISAGSTSRRPGEHSYLKGAQCRAESPPSPDSGRPWMPSAGQRARRHHPARKSAHALPGWKSLCPTLARHGGGDQPLWPRDKDVTTWAERPRDAMAGDKERAVELARQRRCRATRQCCRPRRSRSDRSGGGRLPGQELIGRPAF